MFPFNTDLFHGLKIKKILTADQDFLMQIRLLLLHGSYFCFQLLYLFMLFDQV